MSIKNKKAFTLIELLVVVVIIGILAAIALPQYLFAVIKARATESLVVGKTIVSAQNRYFLAKDSYATKLEDLDVNFACKTTQVNVCNFGSYVFTLHAAAYGFTEPYLFISISGSDTWLNWKYKSSPNPTQHNIECCTRDNMGHKICQSLGGEHTRITGGNQYCYGIH